MQTIKAKKKHRFEETEKFTKSFVEDYYNKHHPRKLILNIAKNYIIFNISTVLAWMILLIFVTTFDKRSSVAEITCFGLCTILNSSIFAVGVSISAGSSTLYVKALASKKVKRLRSVQGTLLALTIFCLIVTFLLLFFVGKYIVVLQNFHLPHTYKLTISTIILWLSITSPFIILIIIICNGMVSEGKTWINSFIGILAICLLIIFVIIGHILFQEKMHHLYHTLTPERFTETYDKWFTNMLMISFFFTFFTTFIILLFIWLYLIVTGRTHFKFHLGNIFYIKLSELVMMIQLFMSIIIRTIAYNAASIICIYVLVWIPIPATEKNITNVFREHNLDTGLYWQFIYAGISSLYLLVLRGMFSVGGSPVRYLCSYFIEKKDYKKYFQTIRWGFIYLLIYVFVIMLIIFIFQKYILEIFNVSNHTHFIFNEVGPNGKINQIKAIGNHANDYGRIILMFTFITIPLLTIQPIITTLCFTTHSIKTLYFSLLLDKLFLELPLFVLLGFVGKEMHSWWIIWFSYLMSDTLYLAMIFPFLVHIMRSHFGNKRESIYEKNLAIDLAY